MLVLARKSNELIHIGDNITVKVISIRNGQVKLGIDAPRDIRVTREGRRDDAGSEGGEPATGRSSATEGDAVSPEKHKDV